MSQPSDWLDPEHPVIEDENGRWYVMPGGHRVHARTIESGALDANMFAAGLAAFFAIRRARAGDAEVTEVAESAEDHERAAAMAAEIVAARRQFAARPRRGAIRQIRGAIRQIAAQIRRCTARTHRAPRRAARAPAAAADDGPGSDPPALVASPLPDNINVNLQAPSASWAAAC